MEAHTGESSTSFSHRVPEGFPSIFILVTSGSNGSFAQEIEVVGDGCVGENVCGQSTIFPKSSFSSLFQPGIRSLSVSKKQISVVYSNHLRIPRHLRARLAPVKKAKTKPKSGPLARADLTDVPYNLTPS